MASVSRARDSKPHEPRKRVDTSAPPPGKIPDRITGRGQRHQDAPVVEPEPLRKQIARPKAKTPAGELARGELAFIGQIRTLAAAQPAHPAVRTGIGDDCAVLAPPVGHELCLTTDFSIEGRHFRRDWHSPAAIGHRALTRGLSDLAAMGAEPLAALLSLALPPQQESSSRPQPGEVRKTAFLPQPDVASSTQLWLTDFLQSMLALARAHNISFAGGDTAASCSSAILIDIVLIGSLPAGTALLRSGARPGNAIYVTGTLGAAALELHDLQQNRPTIHTAPQPRIATGIALRGLATACIDLSDGLSTDLAHICSASNVAATLDYAAIPRALQLRRRDPALARRCILHGGEDYELLFTADPRTVLPKSLAGVHLTRIGTIARANARQPQITLTEPDGTITALPRGGWEHLR